MKLATFTVAIGTVAFTMASSTVPSLKWMMGSGQGLLEMGFPAAMFTQEPGMMPTPVFSGFLINAAVYFVFWKIFVIWFGKWAQSFENRNQRNRG